MVRTFRLKKSLVIFTLALAFGAGCGRMTTYTKPNAPWRTIQKVAVTPFSLSMENSTRQQLVTQLFAEQLRKTGLFEVTEVPSSTLAVVPLSVQEVARKYEVDAVFTGSVDNFAGTMVHIQLHDPATQEVLWSGTYSLGVGAEFFSIHTQQQQFQKSLQKLVNELSRRRF